MGGADIIPGVSGGTMALVTGIYERLVTAISHVDTVLLGEIRRRRWLAAAEHIDLTFLVVLGLGILTGVGCMSQLMHYLLDEHVELTLATFFGLILASSFVVARSVEQWNACKAAWLVAGACFAYWIVGLPISEEVTDSGIYLFICGMTAICAMILPGISGAFILLIMGQYEYVTGIIKGLPRGEASINDIVSLAIFAAGCGIGLLSFSKFLRWLLARYHEQTMAVLCGFIIGSLRRVWPFKIWPEEGPTIKTQYDNILPASFDGHVALALVLAVAAIVFVVFIDWISRREQEVDREEGAEARG